MSKIIELHKLKSTNIPLPIHSLKISAHAFRLYSYLTARAGRKGVTWTGRRTMMKDLNNTSPNSFVRWIKELDDYGLVRQVRKNENSRTYYVIGYSRINQKDQLEFFPSEEAEKYLEFKLLMPEWRDYILKVA